MSYDVGGSIRAKLEDMPDESLKAQLKSSSSESIKNDIKQILATRNMAGIKQAASGGVMRFDEGKLASLSPELINSAITMGPDNSGNTFLNSRIAEARAAEDKAAARAVSEQATKDSVKGFFKNLGDRSAFRRSDNATPAVPTKTSDSKSAMTPDMQNLLSSALAESKGSGPYPTLPNNDPKSPSYIPPNLRAPDLSGIKQAVAPAGAPAPAPAPDKNAKIPTDRVNAIVGQNQQLKDAMGDNTPEAMSERTLGYFEKLSEKMGISTKPPVDEYAGKTTAQIANKLEAERAQFLGKNPSGDQRKQIMEERANAQDEAKRTQAMRMAEFFALWGSTPGNTLVAGLNAMKNKIPDFIADRKEATKIRREMDKSIAELDRVDYLEKAGRWDEAEKKRAKATETALNTWGIYTTKALSLANTVTKEIGDTKRNEATIKGRSEDARTQARATVEAANIRASNTDIKDYGTVQARITSLMTEQRNLEMGPLKDDLRMLKFKDKILGENPDPKKLKAFNEASTRVNERLEPIKREIEQLNRVKNNLGAMQNLPGQASSSASDTVIRYNAKGEVIK
jgi:soluble cytochrome b562